MDSSQKAKTTEHPKPAAEVLKLAQLEPGDILLSRGDSRISDLIVEADHGSFSHAALWTGSSIIESTLKEGIQEHAASGRRYVYRYRDVRDPQAKPGLSAQDAAQVVAAARAQVGKKYDTAEIHLLAVVFQRWWPAGRPKKSLADAILDALGGAVGARLKAWLQSVYTRSAPRICTELVALSYYQANKPLRIKVLADRPTVPDQPAPGPRDASLNGEESDDLATLERNVTKALWEDEAAVTSVARALRIDEAETKGLLYGVLAEDDSGNPVSVVTPGDLQFSSSLQLVGILDAVQP